MEVVFIIIICVICAAVGNNREIITIERGGCVLAVLGLVAPPCALLTYAAYRWLV